MRRKEGQARTSRRVGNRPRRQQQRKSHHRQPRLFHHRNLQAVGQPAVYRQGRRKLRLRRRLRPRRPIQSSPVDHCRPAFLRQHPQPHPIAVQRLLRRLQHFRRLHRQVRLQSGVYPVRIAVKGVVIVQRIGPAAEPANPGKLPIMVAFQPILGPGQFLLSRRLLLNSLDFRRQRRLYFPQGFARRRRSRHYKLPGNFRRIVPHADALRDLLFIDQRPIQAGTLPLGQHRPQHFQRRLLRIPLRFGRPGQIDPGQGNLVPHLQFHPPGQRRIKPPDPRRRRPRRQIPEIAVRQLQRPPLIHIPGNGQTGIRRRIEPLKKILDVIQTRRVQILLRPDGHPVVGMRQGKQGFLDMPLGHPVGAVLVALPPLVFHHFPLNVKPLLIQRRQQKAHPVGFQPQGQLQIVGRHILPIVGAVGIGRAVQVRPHPLQRLEIALVMVLGALEHHVLEQMGKAGAPRLLILGTHMVPDIHRRQRQGIILMQDNLQPVRQRKLLPGNPRHKPTILSFRSDRPVLAFRPPRPKHRPSFYHTSAGRRQQFRSS